MPIMIWIAAIIEAAIEAYPDMAILLGIQFINASIGYYEITKAGDAVAKLKESLKAKATVCRDGKMVDCDAVDLVPGDLVLLAAGSCVPADCRVNPDPAKPGAVLLDVDESSMNGESRPAGKFATALVMMGTVVVRGETHGTVQYTGAKTELGTTAALLRDDGEMSNLQRLLVSIVFILVVISVALCLIVLIYLATQNGITFKENLSFVVVVLVASIPMAVEIVTTTTLSLGSAELNAEGAIVSRLTAIEDMAGMSILCSDKTGTLTTNKMEIQQDAKFYSEGVDRFQLLRFSAMAAKWKDPPRDALDTMLFGAMDKESMKNVVQSAFVPFDPITKRTEGTVTDPDFHPELPGLVQVLQGCAQGAARAVSRNRHGSDARAVRGRQ